MKTFAKSVCLFLLAAWAGSATAQTGTPAATNQPATAPKTPPRRFSGKIASVDIKTKTVTLQGEEKVQVVLTDKSRIIRAKKQAAFNVLAKDQAVTGIERQDSTGKWLVDTLNVGDPRQVLDAPVPKTFVGSPKTNAVH